MHAAPERKWKARAGKSADPSALFFLHVRNRRTGFRHPKAQYPVLLDTGCKLSVLGTGMGLACMLDYSTTVQRLHQDALKLYKDTRVRVGVVSVYHSVNSDMGVGLLSQTRCECECTCAPLDH